MVHSPWPITIAIVVQIMTNSCLLLKWHNLLYQCTALRHSHVLPILTLKAMDHGRWSMDRGPSPQRLPLLPFLQLIIKLLQKVFGKVAQVF